MYNKLPVKERIELMKSYRKANKDMSYRDMVKDYNDSYQKFQNGGKVEFNSGGETHVVYKKESPTGNGKGIEGHIMINHPTKDKGKWDTIDLTDITNYKVKTVQQGIESTKQWHKENPEYAYGGIQKFGDGGKMPKLIPRNFAKEKANYEEQTRGANQMDGTGISSAELAYKYAKLISPPNLAGAAISGIEIGKNIYNNDKQDPIDYLGLLRIPYVKEGMKQIPKLSKQLNKLYLMNTVVGKSNDIAESYE